MGKKANASGRNIPQINPQQLIQQDLQANRMDTVTPFGSQRYTTGPDGRTTYTTELSPQMQAAQDRMFALAAKGSQKWNAPEKFGSIMQALINRNSERIK